MPSVQQREDVLVSPSPIDEPSWPMQCICSLCECGAHRCSSFGLDATHEQVADNNKTPAHLGPMRHCCNYAAATERLLTPSEQQQLFVDNEALQTTTTTTTATTTPTTATAAPTHRRQVAEPAVAELLRVLVARPELARPRDNIVFEGDMDLRTTFETSYEALARMRLDQWRRYQEQQRHEQQRADSVVKQRQQSCQTDDAGAEGAHRGQAGAAAASPGQTPCRGAGAANHDKQPLGKYVSVEMSKQLNESGDQMGPNKADADALLTLESCARPEKAGGFGHAPSNAEHSASKCDSADDKAQLVGRSAATPGSSLSAFAAKQQQRQRPNGRDKRAITHKRDNTSRASLRPTNDNKHNNSHEQCTRPADVDDDNDHDDHDHYDHDQGQQTHASVAASGAQSRKPAQIGHEHIDVGDYIDPDLSPIIVYDANMNRLERVGLRKRSKYRPSTSLRTGARGLFGDQSESFDKQNETNQGPHEVTQDKIRAIDSHAAGMTSQELDTRTGMRNMQFARDPYSNRQNVQIQSKRHAMNNINEIDHIRDNQEHAERKERALMVRPRHERRYVNHATGTETPQMAEEQELEQQRLAQQEEADAVAEIQRCTLSDTQQQINQDSTMIMNEPTARDTGDLASRNSSRSMATNASSEHQRLARMQRMCQNQSFHLFANEYPEPKDAINYQQCKIGAGRHDVAGAGLQQQLRANGSKKNLFRESPDFILTTGHKSVPGKDNIPSHTDKLRTSTVNKHRSSESRASVVGGGGGAAAVEQANRMEQFKESYLGADEKHDKAHGFSSLKQTKASENDVMYKNVTMFNGNKNGRVQPESPCRKCRVLNLDQDFEFVGLRSGHKYFIEKQYSTTPMSELIKD